MVNRAHAKLKRKLRPSSPRFEKTQFVPFMKTNKLQSQLLVSIRLTCNKGKTTQEPSGKVKRKATRNHSIASSGPGIYAEQRATKESKRKVKLIY